MAGFFKYFHSSCSLDHQSQQCGVGCETDTNDKLVIFLKKYYSTKKVIFSLSCNFLKKHYLEASITKKALALFL